MWLILLSLSLSIIILYFLKSHFTYFLIIAIYSNTFWRTLWAAKLLKQYDYNYIQIICIYTCISSVKDRNSTNDKVFSPHISNPFFYASEKWHKCINRGIDIDKLYIPICTRYCDFKKLSNFNSIDIFNVICMHKTIFL